MEQNIRKQREHLSIILISLFACAFVVVAGAALVTAIKWQPLLSTTHIPPNGTPGSALPGTIGLARPHPTMPAQ
jgi:hypothetical protein